MLARQEEGAGPGEQVDADQGELEPHGVDGELADKRPNPLSFRCGYGPPRARGCGDVPFGIVYGLRMSVRPRPRRLWSPPLCILNIDSRCVGGFANACHRLAGIRGAAV
jgi:hypothetical protein